MLKRGLAGPGAQQEQARLTSLAAGVEEIAVFVDPLGEGAGGVAGEPLDVLADLGGDAVGGGGELQQRVHDAGRGAGAQHRVGGDQDLYVVGHLTAPGHDQVRRRVGTVAPPPSGCWGIVAVVVAPAPPGSGA